YLFVTVAGLTTALLPMNILTAPGDLFETDHGSSTIIKFTPVETKSTFATGLGGPLGLAIDRFGNLFEASFDTGTIFKFTPAGVKTTFATGLQGPFGLSFGGGTLGDSDTGSLPVVISISYVVKSTFALGLNPLPVLVFAASGNLFEADQGSGTIFKFTPA